MHFDSKKIDVVNTKPYGGAEDRPAP